MDVRDIRARAWRANAIFLPAMWVVLFLPAWTLDYWQAWLYWLIYAAGTLVGTEYFIRHDPKLVERRLAVGPAAEKEPRQKLIMTAASAIFIVTLIVPGIDHRLHWSELPVWPALLGEAGVLAGYTVIVATVMENSFAAATIRVEAGQPIISTGPYALVRHPMYSGALLMLGLTPLALGSAWGLLMIVPIFAGLAWRLIDEERVLKRDLPGYEDYCRRVRFRLLPGVW
jgi:protein-S-isoprenylcysteine O-methyltransferase Ste14